MLTGTQGLILFSAFRTPQIFKTWFRLLLRADLCSYTSSCRHGGGYTWGWSSLCPSKERGCSGMRSSSRICSFCTLIWWACSLSAGWKEDWLEKKEKSCVHHWEIQFSRWVWKISPAVRAADLSLPAVTDSQNGWGWKKSLDVISSNPTAQAGPSITSYPGPCLTGFWLSPSRKSPQQLPISSGVWSLVCSEQEKRKKTLMFPDTQVTLPVFQFMSWIL